MHYQDPSHPSSRPGGHELDDDFVLMTAIARRDPNALSHLYDRHATIIHTLVLRILKDPAAAEDCLIDIFQELWDRADRYNPARGTPIAYLVTLARSRALDRLRTRKAHEPAPLHEATNAPAKLPDPLQAAVDEERRILIRHALDKLDPKYQEVLECSFFEGLSHTEIALKLGKPVGTVKTYLRRGLIQLRDFLRSPDEGT